MKRRKWDSEKKFKIVLEGLKGRAVSEICNDHQISQAQYYQWRDKFLSNGSKAFDVAKENARETRQANEIVRLKAMVGELTMEIKKSDELLGKL